MKKVILASFLMIFAASSIFAISNSEIAAAASCDGGGANFFGLPAWYRGLTESDCSIKKIGDGGIPLPDFIWTIVGNIFDGIFRVAGVIAVGYIMWGGIQYMLASGDPGKNGKAKTTITNAVIGLIIAVVASAIVNLVMGVF